jgi:peptidyl-prolyl cis-trans isomerase SurA
MAVFLPVMLAVVSAMPERGSAQDVQRIAAVVNEEVISIFDVEQRLRILIVSAGLPNTPEARRRFAPQVLRGLIDEALQQQEARRLNIQVNQRDIDGAILQIERANGIPAGEFESFVRSQGIALNAAVEQIRANIAWQKLLARTVVPTIEIGDEEIDTVIARIEANRGVTEHRVAEILLPVDDPADAQDIHNLAERLVTQVRRGADFRAVAQQFSKSATAATGGEIGWVQPGELGTGLDSVLATLEPGQVSDPIEVPEGFQILALIEQRTNEPPDPNERRVSLRQMLLGLPSDAQPAEVNAQMQTAQAISGSVRGCADFAAAAEEAGSPQPATPTQFTLRDLNEQLREIAATLPVGEASTPIRNPAGVQVLMVCERQENVGPNRGEIENTLLRERVDMLSRRYLRDLRRAAFVDLRV